MYTIKKKINLNVRYPNNYQIVHAMQGDHDTIEITATIYDGNEKYVIDCDMIEIECITPKRTKNSISIKSHTENTVTFSLNKKVLAEEGKHELIIRFMDNPNISLTTFPAIIYVVQAPIGEFTPGEFATITELVFETKDYLRQTIEYYKNLIAEKGQPNGIATLDENGKLSQPQLPDTNVQADWSVTDSSSDAFIKNKPASMPANGGNADTIDNKHASDFLASTTHYAASDSVGGAAEIAKQIPVNPTPTPTVVGSIWITT